MLEAKKLIKSTIVADLRVSGEIGKKRDRKYAGLNKYERITSLYARLKMSGCGLCDTT